MKVKERSAVELAENINESEGEREDIGLLAKVDQEVMIRHRFLTADRKVQVVHLLFSDTFGLEMSATLFYVFSSLILFHSISTIFMFYFVFS